MAMTDVWPFNQGRGVQQAGSLANGCWAAVIGVNGDLTGFLDGYK